MTETSAPTCARHPKVATYLRCAACNTPICDKCAVETAVGYKCRDCGTHHAGAYSPPSVGRAIALAAACVFAGALGTLLFSGWSYWGVLIAMAYGRLVGTLALKVSGRKIGLVVDVLTGAGIAAGGLLVAWPTFVIGARVLQSAFTPFTLIGVVTPLAVIVAITAAAISRMRWPFGDWWF